MSRNEPVEILVAVHRDYAKTNGVLVSINGEGNRATWIARKLISSYHLIGTSTEGTDEKGNRKRLPLANMTVPEWLAKDRGVHLTIPSPRKFIEIVLCFAVAAVVLCCLTLVLIVLAIFAAIESVVDRFKVWRVRR